MADKLATAFTPITNPAGTRLIMIADEATGERYKISIADFFALVQSGVQFTGGLEVNGNLQGGDNAWFGEGYITDPSYHYDDARVTVTGIQDGGQFEAGIHFIARNTGGTDYWNGKIQFDSEGGFNLYQNGAGVNEPALVTFKVSRTGHVSMPALPTSDPVEAGALWNNAGVMNISTGV